MVAHLFQRMKETQPMRRLMIPALLLALAAGAVTAAQQPTFNTNKTATLVMKNGNKHTGTLVYHNDNNFNLIENGQEKAYPVDRIALVELAGGSPSTSELTQLPTSGDPPELQRHMLVLRDGSTIKGKLYTIKETAFTFDTENGQRRDFEISNIARMFVSAPGARSLYAEQINNQASNPTPTTGGGQVVPGSITVNASAGWVDTGRTVRRGQRVTFEPSGEIHFGRGPDQVADANGRQGDPSQPTLPVPSAGVGALIGRIGAGAPFVIGAQGAATMPANGRLFLAVNDRELSDNSGAFSVVIR
jgi:hypothetical protein